MKVHNSLALSFFSICVMMAASTCLAQTTSAKAVSTPGLPVGKKAPDFILNDQSGGKLQLSKLLAKGPVAIVFHRSADW